MAREYEYPTADGSLKYQKTDEGVEITGISGLAGKICVPDSIEGMAVTGIARKAFLSRKHLRRIELPGTVEQIGDWAFAYCDALREVVFGGSRVSFGKAVFLECGSLQKISVCHLGEPSKLLLETERGIDFLLAAAVTGMDSYYLLDLSEAGSGEWLEKWDARMLAILHTPDSEGYSKQVLCGEEDYGSTDLRAYLSERRKEKARLAFLRLLYPVGMAEKNREEIRTYLLVHTRGCRSEEAWQVILREHPEDRPYYELFAEIGCFHRENAADVIAQIGENAPEMKAFFLRYQAERFDGGDFFAGLEL